MTPASCDAALMLLLHQAEAGVAEFDEGSIPFRAQAILHIVDDGMGHKQRPANSSNVGRLIACTLAQKWPLPLPRSRNQRPPGQASSLKSMGPLGESRCCSSSRSDSKVTSIGAFTLTTCSIVMVQLSM